MFFISRYLYVFLICLFFVSSCKESKKVRTEKQSNLLEQQEESSQKFPKFAFTKEIHKFGEISEGEVLICEFYFKNVGHANLIIKSVESSCGCTVVKWNHQPIELGEESKITVEFDSKGRYGKQYKVLTIFANTKREVKELKITATVV